VSTFWEPTMKKLSSIGVVAFAALIAGLAILGFSTPAQAYPDVRIDLTVNRSTLYGGQKFTATASSTGTTCSWTVDWHAKVRLGSSHDSSPFRTTFTAPQVTKVTKIPLHGTCVYSAPSARGTATWPRTIMITVLPRSAAVSPPGGSDLPNTGGPNLLFLVGGLVLLASGATAVTVARRRAEEAELQASRA
jgi:LPXTG-motif cell wall-anchored protein